MSAPVTLAGTVCVAELLAGWTLGYVVDPDLPAGGIVTSGALDMQSAAACFGSPEALLQDVTTVQLCRRLYDIPVSAATGYVDCKRPGLEATFQKLYPLLAVPFGAARRIDGAGLLSAGPDYSPVQHILDAEMNAAIDRFWGGFEVTDDTIALDLIREAVQQDTGFLETEHTAERFRSEQRFPRWLDRTLWRGAQAERTSEQDMPERIHPSLKGQAGGAPARRTPVQAAEGGRQGQAGWKRYSGSTMPPAC